MNIRVRDVGRDDRETLLEHRFDVRVGDSLDDVLGSA